MTLFNYKQRREKNNNVDYATNSDADLSMSVQSRIESLATCIHLSGGGLAQWLALPTSSRPGRVAVRCGLEQVIFPHCLVLVKHRKPWTYD